MLFYRFQSSIFYLCIVSALSFPSKKVLFPSDSEEIDAQYTDESYDSVDQNDNSFKLQFRIDATKVPCSNASIPFCEDTNQRLYPKQYVESVLQRSLDQYTEFFNKLEVRDDFMSSMNLCDTHRRLIHPQLAMNTQNDWRFVINQANYRQPIRVELCQKRASKCQFSESFSADVTSSCTQKYTEIPLLSLGDDGELLEYTYKFPSHCQCEMREVKRKKDKVHTNT